MTPGPWHIEMTSQRHDGEKWVDREWTICHGINRHKDGPEGNVCKVVSTKDDADLITAAPDLLDVAQNILADDLIQYLPAEYIAKVRAAIAKATGGKA